MSDCLFCKIIKKEIPANVVYEDDLVLCFLDINPSNPGHVLVAPKKHAQDLFDVTTQDLTAVMNVVPIVAKKVLKAVDAEAFNLHVNHGEIAGQVIPHLHFHIIPRFQDDGLQLFKGKPASPNELNDLAAKIKSA